VSRRRDAWRGQEAQFEPGDLSTTIAAEVKGFDPASVLEGKRLRRSARFTQFAIQAAREAVADAALVVDDGNRGQIGVVVNAAVAGFDTIEDATRALPHRLSPYFVASSLTNMPACEVAIDLGVHGPVTASALACASGVYALVEARRLLLAGEADVVICGGTDAPPRRTAPTRRPRSNGRWPTRACGRSRSTTSARTAPGRRPTTAPRPRRSGRRSARPPGGSRSAARSPWWDT
jgi:hypothetical protein